MAQQQNANPQIKWDGKNFSVTLPVAATLELKKGGVVEAKWNPNFTFVVRVREVGTDKQFGQRRGSGSDRRGADRDGLPPRRWRRRQYAPGLSRQEEENRHATT